MKTKFKLYFESDPPDIDKALFIQSLPDNFELTQEENTFYISILSNESEDRKCQFFIDRELDRHFFLTSVKIEAKMVKAKGLISASHASTWRAHNGLNENIAPQQWNYELPLQLRLWSMAIDSNQILLKVIFYFQIIELSYPDPNNIHHYPKYLDIKSAPAPLTECKMLRNLAVHSGNKLKTQQKSYCDYLKIPQKLYDPTDPIYTHIFEKKLILLETEAKKAIEKSL